MLYPQSVEEYIELGLHGFAMSRFAGLPVGFKALADTEESSGSISADCSKLETLLPRDFRFRPGVYCESIENAVRVLNASDVDTAIAMAKLPEQIRGFGHVKETSIAAVRVRWDALTHELKVGCEESQGDRGREQQTCASLDG